MSSMPREALNTRASKPGADGGAELHAQGLGALDDSCGSVKSAGVMRFIRRQPRSQHALGADVEQLDDALSSVAILESSRC